MIPVVDLAHRRRLRPGLRPLAGDPAVRPVRPASSSTRCRPAPVRAERRPAGARFAGRVAGRRLARRDLPRGHDRRRGPIRALQGRRSVVPQLDRPGDGAARPADFRFPAVQQELQPVVLRTRFVRERLPMMFEQFIAERLRQGHRTIAVSRGSCRSCPTDFAGCRSLDSHASAPTAASACAEACPTDAIAQRRQTLQLDMGRCLFCTECVDACPDGRDLATARTIGWPRARARTWSPTAGRCELAAGARRKDAAALRPLAQAAAGQRRRLQRLRGRRQRARARSSSTWAASASSSSPRRATPTAC